MNRQQLLQALVYLIMALFIGGSLAPQRKRPLFRRVTIALYALAAALALVWVALWMTEPARP